MLLCMTALHCYVSESPPLSLFEQSSLTSLRKAESEKEGTKKLLIVSAAYAAAAMRTEPTMQATKTEAGMEGAAATAATAA